MNKTRIETARLILRPIRPEDFEPWAEAMTDVEVTRFIMGPQSRDVAWRSFVLLAWAWEMQGLSVFSVVERSSGRWVGYVGPKMLENWPGIELGWVIVREAWGQGYATEGAKAVIDWAFGKLDWTEVVHCISPDNQASQAVARKLGSTCRGPAHLPAPFDIEPLELWVQTREQWLQRRHA